MGRHVDLWTKFSAVHSVRPSMTKAPVPCRDEGLGSALEWGVTRQEGRRSGDQRQRIDMTSPATIAPKPMAKFQAESVCMNAMCSPAT